MTHHILKNNFLSLTIAEPGTAYARSRFDWTGFITDICYLGHHTFTVPESLISEQGTGGIGFCNEFGIDQPIGYDQCAYGESFPKIGVGLLKKDDSDYFFAKDYDITANTYAITECSKDTYEIHSWMADSSSYAYLLQKKIQIQGHVLTIDYNLTNRGSKTITTNEYNHNFIGIDGQLVNKDYVLEMPIAKSLSLKAGQCDIQDTCLTWSSTPKEDFYVLGALKPRSSSYNWNLYHKEKGVGIKECSNFPISKLAIWGAAHVISPELFFQIDLSPNQTLNWQRKYLFYTL